MCIHTEIWILTSALVEFTSLNHLIEIGGKADHAVSSVKLKGIKL